jgi:hypothetical protein
MYDFSNQSSYDQNPLREVGLKSNINPEFDATEFIPVAIPIGKNTT